MCKMKQSILFKSPPPLTISYFPAPDAQPHTESPGLSEKLHSWCILINVKLFFFFFAKQCVIKPAGDRKCLRPSVRPHFASKSPRNEEADAPLNHRPCQWGILALLLCPILSPSPCASMPKSHSVLHQHIINHPLLLLLLLLLPLSPSASWCMPRKQWRQLFTVL